MTPAVLISHASRGGIRQYWYEMKSTCDCDLIVMCKTSYRNKLLKVVIWLIIIGKHIIKLLLSNNQSHYSNDMVSHLTLIMAQLLRPKLDVTLMFHGTDFLGKKYSSALLKLINYSILHGAKVIFVSNFLLQEYKSRGLVADNARVVFPIITTDFNTDARPINSKSATFIFVGHLNNQKGILDILSILSEVTRLNKYANFALKIIGDGSNRELIESTLFPFKVDVLGALPFDEVQDHLADADLLLFYPRELEAFGKVIVEANLNGCNVLMCTEFATSEVTEICSALLASSKDEFIEKLRQILLRKISLKDPFVKYINPLQLELNNS